MPVLLPSARRLPVLALVLALLAAPAAAREAVPGDLLDATLSGEFALQAGRLDEAADAYLRAARAADGDAALAERAVRIALLANDDERAGEALRLWAERAPRSIEMRGIEATWLLRTGRDRAARRELVALLRDPDPAGWRHALAALGTGSRDPEDASRLLGRLVDSGAIPDDLQAWLAFGGLAQRLGGDVAPRILDEVVRRFPQEPRVALLRAAQLREDGDAEDARAALALIEDQALLSPELRLAIAAEYDSLGAAADAARIMGMGPQDERSYGLRASLLVKAEDKPALEALYAELRGEADAPDPGRRLLLGQMAEYLERYEEALEWYESVPGGEPRNVARMRATRVLFELGRKDEAFAALRAIQGDAAADDNLRRDGYLLEAELHQQDDRPDAELDAYNRGLGAHPDDGALLYARALMWERRDDVPRAEADLRRILVAEPENVAALNALGYTLADRTDRYREALELIDRARVAEPDNAAIIDSYGWVLYRLGRNAEALVELRRAWTLMKDPEVAAHIAEVLWAMGRQDEAREYFRRANELDPDNRSLRRALENTGVEL
ncbi:tetratricopeptide repeat protein [Luteimonas sp. Y-2-2-4F]|nr:tetratricopeptide repeat protein [Luteimonas sp. Y-2-2-4F]MCD9033782.1 tetratricopeptide repeat protein [Luteimonas sp. Y-2-2-4F]